MYAIVNKDSREVMALLSDRPKNSEVILPLISVYVTEVEASQLSLPWDEWVPVGGDSTISNLVHHRGTIVPQDQLNSALNRQSEIIAVVQNAINFGKSISGTAFTSLTDGQLRGVVGLLCAANGWVDINGNIDLSDFTVDSILTRIRD